MKVVLLQMFLSQKLFIVNGDGTNLLLASPVSCICVLKTWSKNVKIKISHIRLIYMYCKGLIMCSHEVQVLDITIGTTMLAIFPTAASIQLVSKVFETTEHDEL